MTGMSVLILTMWRALSIILLTEPPNNSVVKAELQTLPSRGDVRVKTGGLGEACTCSAYKPQDPNPYPKPQCKFRSYFAEKHFQACNLAEQMTVSSYLLNQCDGLACDNHNGFITHHFTVNLWLCLKADTRMEN